MYLNYLTNVFCQQNGEWFAVVGTDPFGGSRGALEKFDHGRVVLTVVAVHTRNGCRAVRKRNRKSIMLHSFGGSVSQAAGFTVLFYRSRLQPARAGEKSISRTRFFVDGRIVLDGRLRNGAFRTVDEV